MLTASIPFSAILFLMFVGIVSGILSSAPLGPADFWLVTAIMPPSKPFKNLVAYVSGIIVVDILYAFIAFLGYYVYLQGTAAEKWLGIIGGLGLILIGGLECKNLIDQKESSADLVCDKKSSMIKDFAVGAFICGSNPAFIMFWLMVAKWLHQYDAMFSSLGNASYVYVFVGIAIGDVLWYSFFAKLVQMGLSFISMRFIFYLRQAISASLIMLGVLAVINYI